MTESRDVGVKCKFMMIAELDMITRRKAMAVFANGAASVFVWNSGQADVEEQGRILTDYVPNEDGDADFADAWEVESGSQATLVAGGPDIETDYAEDFGNVFFSNSNEVDSEFEKRTGAGFIKWFNSSVANKGAWASKIISGINVEDHFKSFWDQYLLNRRCSLMEFLCYSSVFVNECNGNLVYKAEGFGSKGHPGIAYLFDTIVLRSQGSDRLWRKASYNTGTQNKTAGALFNDPNFNKAHGKLGLGDALANTSDEVWWGDTFPSEKIPTAANMDVNGYILQADFFKFRGRGLIQTTWRSNYRKLVDFIKDYSGNNNVLQKYRDRWGSFDSDLVCTISRDSDWNEIFGEEQRIILCEAITQHANAAHYIPLAKQTVGLNSAERGSVVFMGNSVGGLGYGPKIKARVRQLCHTLQPK